MKAISNHNYDNVKITVFGQEDYRQCWQAMKDLTLKRSSTSQNEIWFVEHPSTFTLGRAGKTSNLLMQNVQNDIPLIKTDRGGDITYHGPGQMVAYLLFDITRGQIGIRTFVRILEQSVVDCLDKYSIPAYTIEKRPGIYTQKGKISSIGLALKKYGTYHGISLNVDMDLTPFSYINPCGIKQQVTQIKEFDKNIKIEEVRLNWLNFFFNLLNKTNS